MLVPIRKSFLITGCILVAVLFAGCGRSPQKYIDKGNQLFNAGKYDDAILNYRNAINKDSNSGEAYYRLGLALLKLNRGAEAYQDLTRAVSLSPQNTAAKVELANLSLAAYARDSHHPPVLYNQAKSLANELLAKNPNSTEGLRVKGAIALIDNRPGDAVEAFRRGLAISPASKELSTDVAEALLRDGRREEGEQAARDAIRKSPKYPPPYELLYAFYISQKREADAEALLKLWMANSSDDSAPILRLAALYYRQQKAPEAENLLSSLLQRRATFAQADLLVGDFHVLIRNWDKALADYQRGRSLDRAHEALYQEREAGVLATMGRKDEALKAADAILARDAKNTFARSLKVQMLIRTGGAANLTTAASLANDLAKENPGNAQIQTTAGQAFAAKGDLDSAAARFRQAVAADPQMMAPKLALARIGILRRNFQSVLEQAGAALAIKPNDPDAQLLRVIGLTGTGSYAQAKVEAEQLAKGTNDAAPVEMQLGIIALRQKNYPDAEKYFRKLYREGDSNLEPLTGLVSTFIEARQPDRALQLAEAELKRTPDSPNKAALLISVAQAAGKPDLAVEELEKLAARNPKSPEIQIQLAEMERKQGNLAAALSALQRAQQLAPSRKGLNAALGNIQEVLGRKTEALASYRKALSEAPEDPVVLNDLAFLLTDMGGDLNEALQLATTANRKAPHTPAIEDTLAWIHVKQGNSATVLPVLTRLAHLDPANATFQYHYGVALLQKGDRAMAKQELEAALAKKPDQRVETEIRNLLARMQ